MRLPTPGILSGRALSYLIPLFQILNNFDDIDDDFGGDTPGGPDADPDVDKLDSKA